MGNRRSHQKSLLEGQYMLEMNMLLKVSVSGSTELNCTRIQWHKLITYHMSLANRVMPPGFDNTSPTFRHTQRIHNSSLSSRSRIPTLNMVPPSQISHGERAQARSKKGTSSGSNQSKDKNNLDPTTSNTHPLMTKAPPQAGKQGPSLTTSKPQSGQ